MIKKALSILLVFTIVVGFSSCKKNLDRQPLSTLAPENYFTEAAQLMAYTDDMYTRVLPSIGGNSYGIYAIDQNTDNQIAATPDIRFIPGEWKVPNSGGSWSFDAIYRCNFFFTSVLPKFGRDLNGSENKIAGSLANIKHFIGEMYFLRALEYFTRYQRLGDFPIITEPLPDELEPLIEASKRKPRNEVARFILSDLDKAITLLSAVNMQTTRINKDAALLLKSRVALFEGTWLKYFKGTAFVPKGTNWPGAAKDYNANYQFPSGSIDNEINYFLDQAITSSKEVAEKYKISLTANTGVLQQSATDPANLYYNMFGQENLSGIPEVLFWKQYVQGVGGSHDIALAANQGNWGVGVTRGYVQNFLMADGKPVYTHGTYRDGDGFYKGDKTVQDVVVNRDTRLSLFLKVPGQKNILVKSVALQTNVAEIEPVPNITTGNQQLSYPTGYALRKGGTFDTKYTVQGRGYTSVVYYRAAEALLNYMEASYERNGTLDASAREYWTKLRDRAKITGTIDATIAATDMSKEAENDWGAYSGGQILADRTLYNIRRERRSELLAEGFRNMDLLRWRSMDQLQANPYHPEGIHLWNTPMQGWYTNLVSNGSTSANVSPASVSEYLRPYEKRSNQLGYSGLTWRMAHYLEPIMIKQFQLTSIDGQAIENSPIYQNPYWPTVADAPAIQ